MNTKFLWTFTVIFAISVVSCNKDDNNNQEPAPSIVDPKDADAL